MTYNHLDHMKKKEFPRSPRTSSTSKRLQAVTLCKAVTKKFQSMHRHLISNIRTMKKALEKISKKKKIQKSKSFSNMFKTSIEVFNPNFETAEEGYFLKLPRKTYRENPTLNQTILKPITALKKVFLLLDMVRFRKN